MPHKTTHTAELKRALSLIGDKWSSLILLELSRGNTRFVTLKAALGINNTTLTRRLDALTQAGLVTKQAFKEYPPRIEYTLTNKGEDLLPALHALAQWVRKHLLAGEESHR
jgi:DNA-binding HxlR family transcriptional regulator